MLISKGTLLTRLVSGGHHMSRSLHLPARILKCIREAFSHMYHPEGLNILLSLSRLCHWAASSRGKASRTHIPRTRQRVKNFQLPGSSSRVTSYDLQPHFLTLTNLLPLLGILCDKTLDLRKWMLIHHYVSHF